MSTYKALLIPADLSLSVQEVVVHDDGRSIERLVFDGQNGILDFSSFRNYGPEDHERVPGIGVQLAYDDMGLFGEGAVTNHRAMWLWAWMARRTIEDFEQPLVGNYVVMGWETVSGETVDVPPEILSILLDGVRVLAVGTEQSS